MIINLFHLLGLLTLGISAYFGFSNIFWQFLAGVYIGYWVFFMGKLSISSALITFNIYRIDIADLTNDSIQPIANFLNAVYGATIQIIACVAIIIAWFYSAQENLLGWLFMVFSTFTFTSAFIATVASQKVYKKLNKP
jgi:hypothetical protein